MQPINERINQVFAAVGLKRIEIAAKLGVSAAFISQLCSGASTPSARTRSNICRVFNVDELWLETGEGEMFRQQTPYMELATLVGDLMADQPGSFRQRAIAALLRCTDDEWGLFERLLHEITHNEKKDVEP